MFDPALAFLAGLLTVAAPCVLPMLPVVLGVSMGRSHGLRPVFMAIGFAASFCLVALAFGSATHVLGLSQEVLRHIATGVLLVLGVLMIWRTPFDRLMLHLSPLFERADAVGRRAGPGIAGALTVGATLGALFTPCAGPVLGSILTLVATHEDPGRAAALLAAYSAGAAIPMLVIAYGGQFVARHLAGVARWAHRLQQAFGLLVIATALAMLFQYDALVVVWLSYFYPSIATGL